MLFRGFVASRTRAQQEALYKHPWHALRYRCYAPRHKLPPKDQAKHPHAHAPTATALRGQYSPASRFALAPVGLGGGRGGCLAGAFPFFLAWGASLPLWLVVVVEAAMAFFGGSGAFLGLGLGLGSGGAWDVGISGQWSELSMDKKVNRSQLTQTYTTWIQQQASQQWLLLLLELLGIRRDFTFCLLMKNYLRRKLLFISIQDLLMENIYLELLSDTSILDLQGSAFTFNIPD